MRRSKFKKRIEDKGHMVLFNEDDNRSYVIKRGQAGSIGMALGFVYEGESDGKEVVNFRVKTTDRKVAQTIIEYGMTPYPDREDEKQYYYRLPGIKPEDENYLNHDIMGGGFFFGYANEEPGYRTKFVDSNMGFLSDEMLKVISICDKVEVPEDERRMT